MRGECGLYVFSQIKFRQRPNSNIMVQASESVCLESYGKYDKASFRFHGVIGGERRWH